MQLHNRTLSLVSSFAVVLFPDHIFHKAGHPPCTHSQMSCRIVRLYGRALDPVVNPLGPIAPKVAQCNSALHDNSDNSHAFTAPTTHRFIIEDYFDPARLQLLSDLNYNFTLQQAVNLEQLI